MHLQRVYAHSARVLSTLDKSAERASISPKSVVVTSDVEISSSTTPKMNGPRLRKWSAAFDIIEANEDANRR
jgi:hypothetical protein